MKLVKTLAAAAVLAMSSFATQASTINVGGVNWDPESSLDFNGVSATLIQNISTTTGGVSGYGVVTTLNGQGQSLFCPGCQLSFTFGGFQPVGGPSVLPVAGLTGQQINYSGGWMKLFVDHNNDISNVNDPNSLTAANTSNGKLWLDLVAHSINGVSFTGINATSQVFNTIVGSLIGAGQFDVLRTEGTAWANFDTNTRQGGSDLAFTTSFSNLSYTTLGTGANAIRIPTTSFGSGTFTGDTIPTPSSLAVLGLGLIGLVGAARRKAQK